MFWIFLVEQWRLSIINNRWKFQCNAANNKAYRAMQSCMQIAWLKLKLFDKAMIVALFMFT